MRHGDFSFPRSSDKGGVTKDRERDRMPVTSISFTAILKSIAPVFPPARDFPQQQQQVPIEFSPPAMMTFTYYHLARGSRIKYKRKQEQPAVPQGSLYLS